MFLKEFVYFFWKYISDIGSTWVSNYGSAGSRMHRLLAGVLIFTATFFGQLHTRKLGCSIYAKSLSISIFCKNPLFNINILKIVLSDKDIDNFKNVLIDNKNFQNRPIDINIFIYKCELMDIDIFKCDDIAIIDIAITQHPNPQAVWAEETGLPMCHCEAGQCGEVGEEPRPDRGRVPHHL